MTSRIRAFGFTALAAAAFSVLTAPAFAAGPIGTCSSGVAMRWGAGGVGIPFNPDQGDLGPLDHAPAVAAVQAAFDVWGAVANSTVTYTNAGELGVDVDITNFDPFLNPAAPDGLSAIVFDDTGEIFDLLFGPGSGILGFAGPEWILVAGCEVVEGVSFLNGPSFDDAQAASDVMVHEFGHYSGLAHTQVNGNNLIQGDPTGPAPGPGFGDSPLTELETMYPFYFGPGSGTDSPEKDDDFGISSLYPEATYASTTGTISGTVFAPNGTEPLTGINVIARNPADPFNDAVSAISGDYSFTSSSSDSVAGQFNLRGLTPGVSYVLYIDTIGPGGFSTQPRSIPGPEEFFNGANESNDGATDDPQESTAIASVAGVPATGINVIVNKLPPGPVVLNDDDFVEIFPDNPINYCGTSYTSFFINSNGTVSFGAGQTSFARSDIPFVSGAPRVGFWTDLNPEDGGTISWGQTASAVTVSYDAVPSFGVPGSSNTLSLGLRTSPASLSRQILSVGSHTATHAVVGYSCGGYYTSSFEKPSDLSSKSTWNAQKFPTVWERFANGTDLAGKTLTFNSPKVPIPDSLENGNDIANPIHIELPYNTVQPFDSGDPQRTLHSRIEPLGNDVDFYHFSLTAGDIASIELLPGTANATAESDFIVGLYQVVSGTPILVLTNDDGGAGLLPRLLVQTPVTSEFIVAVSTFADFDFSGDGTGAGRYVLGINQYRGDIVDADDDTTTEQALGFAFPYAGTTYTSTWINSNGSLTFGAGDVDRTQTVAEFLAGAPRISLRWSDLDPFFGVILAEPVNKGMRIHFVSVPEFFSDRPNYVSAELLSNGHINTGYTGVDRRQALVGVTPGNGAADPGESNLSSKIVWTGSTVYENFTTTFPANSFPSTANFSDLDLQFGSVKYRQP